MNILAFEQGGSALRLFSQNNGYTQLIYTPVGGVSRVLAMFEETLMAEALDSFHVQLEALQALGCLGRAA